jgi:hypothetical protein
MHSKKQPRTGSLLKLSGMGLIGLISVAQAQEITPAQFDELRAALQKQQKQIEDQAKLLRKQGEQLNAQRQEIDRLTGGPGKRQAAAPASQSPAKSPAYAQGVGPIAPQQPTVASSGAGANSGAAGGATMDNAAPTQVTEDPAAQRERQKDEASRVVQSNISLARNSGVLTPRGTIVIQPEFDYLYQTERQAVVSGFTIIPGITFGNINIIRTMESIVTTAATFRAGITDRLELNMYVPYVAAWASTTTGNVGVNAQPLTASSSGSGVGDIEFGASYQFNQGNDDWPVLVGNLRFKTMTGLDPFSVPIYTINDNNGSFLQGIQKQTPLGTGFYSLEPSLTAIYPSDPLILFGNIRYIHNFSRNVALQSNTGGPAVPTDLHAGDGIGFNFGMGFAINEKTSFSLGYEQVHVFSSTANGYTIGGSNYDLGTLNFGLGYVLSNRVSLNLGVGIGVTPDTPAARIMLTVPISLQAF